MKVLILSMLLLTSVEAATKQTIKKKNKKVETKITTDKIYQIDQRPPEIIIGAPAIVKNNSDLSKNRPLELWYVGLVRSSLSYHLPSFSGGTPTFSPDLIGVSVGKKSQNHFFLYKGYLELAGEWQRFYRDISVGTNSTIYSQKLNMFQFNVFQNFNIGWAFKHKSFFSAGIGLAPVYLTSEKSVFTNSISELGYLGMLKGNIVAPLKNNLELDLGLRIGWGKVGSHEISVSSLSLGLNFE